MDKPESIDPGTLKFKDSKPVQANPERYMLITVDTAKILESWAISLYSFEWIYTNGTIKTGDELKPSDREKQSDIMDAIENGKPLEQPVLGIGIQDNVEIGSGRPVFLTLASLGVKTLPVHILQSTEKDFKAFRTDL